MKEPKISIIIPVYNVERYLNQCMDSIVNQTYENLEIICVDDGSTDNSLNILYHYAATDKRVKIINQKNKGQSAARNLGLRVATGDWLTFVDSDDWIEINLYQKFVCNLNEQDKDFDLYLFNGCFYENGRYLTEHSFLNLNNWIPPEEGSLYTFQHCKSPFRGLLGVYNKIYRTKFFKDNNFKFVEGLIFEDQLFCIEVLFGAKSIFIDNDIYYYYRQNNGSTLATLGKNVYDLFEIFNLLEKFLKDNNLYERHKYAFFQHKYNQYFFQFMRVSISIGEDFYYKCRNDLQESVKDLDINLVNKLHNVSIYHDMVKYTPEEFNFIYKRKIVN